jgi:hypothetical protein
MCDEERAKELEIWANDRKLNPNSPTTCQLFENRFLSVQDYISQFRRGSINTILPEDARIMTVEDAIKIGRVGDVNVRKRLTDNRDKFQKR